MEIQSYPRELLDKLPETVTLEFYGIARQVVCDGKNLNGIMEGTEIDWGSKNIGSQNLAALILMNGMHVDSYTHWAWLTKKFCEYITSKIRCLRHDVLTKTDVVETSFAATIKVREAALAICGIFDTPKPLDYFIEYSDIEGMPYIKPVGYRSAQEGIGAFSLDGTAIPSVPAQSPTIVRNEDGTYDVAE